MQSRRTPAFRERRRRDLRGRVARATFPVRRALGEIIDYFPCSVIGHQWVERKQRGRSALSDVGALPGRKIAFHCSRCRTPAPFTN
jgi:hypothetical protein